MFKCFKKTKENKTPVVTTRDLADSMTKNAMFDSGYDISRDVQEVIVHCSATPDIFVDKDKIMTSEDSRWFFLGAEEIRRWHVEDNGWSDIGYHYVIKRNGILEPGRPLNQTGAHTRGRNYNSIGVCLVGSHSYTKEQKESLKMLYKQLASRYGLSTDKWRCHNEFSNKDCPGFSPKALHKLLDTTEYDLESI